LLEQDDVRGVCFSKLPRKKASKVLRFV